MTDTNKVRALFILNEKIHTTDGFRLNFAVASSQSAEAQEFFKYTPYGTLEMGTVNADAAGMFEPGKAYYLDFSPAE